MFLCRRCGHQDACTYMVRYHRWSVITDLSEIEKHFFQCFYQNNYFWPRRICGRYFIVEVAHSESCFCGWPARRFSFGQALILHLKVLLFVVRHAFQSIYRNKLFQLLGKIMIEELIESEKQSRSFPSFLVFPFPPLTNADNPPLHLPKRKKCNSVRVA